MKIVSKPFTSLLTLTTAFSMLTAVALPVVSSALPAHAAPAGNSTGAGANGQFCTGLNAKAAATNNKITALSAKVTKAWTVQNQKVGSSQAAIDKNIAASRAKADSIRSADFSKLEAKATTPTEQQAVKTYEAAVLQAITVRRGAYDTARQDFRSGLSSLIATHNSTVSTQINSFAVDVQKAFAAAETACSAGSSSPAVVRQDMVASLKTDRETYQGERKGDAALGQQVKQLAATRNASFKQADSAFKTAMSTARAALKAAFGKSSNDV